METEKEMIIWQEENKLTELKRQLSDKYDQISELKKKISEQERELGYLDGTIVKR